MPFKRHRRRVNLNFCLFIKTRAIALVLKKRGVQLYRPLSSVVRVYANVVVRPHFHVQPKCREMENNHFLQNGYCIREIDIL